jgi:hypothetical protein
MELSNDQAKMDLVARLVKDGAIDFMEAVKLLETEKTVVYLPNNSTTIPWVNPMDWQPTLATYGLGPQVFGLPPYVAAITYTNGLTGPVNFGVDYRDPSTFYLAAPTYRVDSEGELKAGIGG